MPYAKLRTYAVLRKAGLGGPVKISKCTIGIHGQRGQRSKLLLLMAIGLESLFVLVLADLLFSLFYDTAHN